MPGLNRFLRVTPSGLLRVDKTKAKAEENLDGKYLLRSCDPQLSAEDIAAGYKQLLQVERGWRDMKSVLDLRPVYHRLEERICAHVLLRWLALLLVRVAETQAGQTWPVMRRELDRIHLGTFTGPAGTFRQRTDLSRPTATCSPTSPSNRPAASTSSTRHLTAEAPAHDVRPLETRPAACQAAISPDQSRNRCSSRAELRGTQAEVTPSSQRWTASSLEASAQDRTLHDRAAAGGWGLPGRGRDVRVDHARSGGSQRRWRQRRSQRGRRLAHAAVPADRPAGKGTREYRARGLRDPE